MVDLKTLEGIVAQTTINIANLSAQSVKTDAKIAKLSAEAKESRKETERILKEQNAEWEKRWERWSERQSAEWEKWTERRSAEWEKWTVEWEKRAVEWEKRSAELDKEVKRCLKIMGDVGITLGNFTERMIIPGIRQKMNELGYMFFSTSPNKKYLSRDGKTITEVDLLLENGNEVMAVEIKTNFNENDVKRHLRRLELLRKYESTTKFKDIILYAAIAGIKIDKSAREAALECGMYVIEIFEDQQKLEVISPEKESIGRW
ncbi:MAG: hypothetical protein LBI42_08925 [Chitinispirillales bacterium]|jgi:hypothetical protein|nr:hypothetical protein [Chitinispirillales bacterium]